MARATPALQLPGVRVVRGPQARGVVPPGGKAAGGRNAGRADTARAVGRAAPVRSAAQAARRAGVQQAVMPRTR